MKKPSTIKAVPSAVRFFESQLLSNAQYKAFCLCLVILSLLSALLCGLFFDAETELNSSAVKRVFLLNETDYEIDLDAVAASNKAFKKISFGTANFSEENVEEKLTKGKLLLKISQQSKSEPIMIETFCGKSGQIDDFSRLALVSAVSAQIKKAQLSEYGAIFDPTPTEYTVTVKAESPYEKSEKTAIKLVAYTINSLLIAAVSLWAFLFRRRYKMPRGAEEISARNDCLILDFWGQSITVFLNIVLLSAAVILGIAISRFVGVRLFGLSDISELTKTVFGGVSSANGKFRLLTVLSFAMSAMQFFAISELKAIRRKSTVKSRLISIVTAAAAFLIGFAALAFESKALAVFAAFVPFASQLVLPIFSLSGTLPSTLTLCSAVLQIVFTALLTAAVFASFKKQRGMNE